MTMKNGPARVLLLLCLFYLSFLCFYEFPFLFRRTPPISVSISVGGGGGGVLQLATQKDTQTVESPVRPSKLPRRLRVPQQQSETPAAVTVSALQFNRSGGSGLEKSALDAWQIGSKLLDELNSSPSPSSSSSPSPQTTKPHQQCAASVSLTGTKFRDQSLIQLPCGLTLGSHITLVARPRAAHEEYSPKIKELRPGERVAMVSQFRMELLGMGMVDGEEPPKILHFNPRLKGDFSGRPVIELNTCYRMQWGAPLRCEGWGSSAGEDTVDGHVKCEKWVNGEDDEPNEPKGAWWLKRIIKRRTDKVTVEWPYPFVEDKLFVLTLTAGLEGYHINVDGRHVTSFPYRTGFALEDATGLSISGDIDVESIYAASLPNSHLTLDPRTNLDMSPQWKAPDLPDEPADLFIGILSAGNHFAERMAIRKSWMSSVRKRSNNVVARFFVALNGRNEVNMELKKEAEFFGDIVIVPFLDSYDLVVLKTIAICEYGIRVVSAKYVMKCDDDNFVRINSVMEEVRKVPEDGSLYMGNINYYHRPLRNGKWAVTYEEWPEEEYPPYANGPGYVVSADIARFIMSDFENNKLRLFKMEDVSMGMWVEKFNATNSKEPVQYIHSFKFCQFGCIDDYYTAHYQSPRQMICMWEKLQSGNPRCCNMR